MEFRKQRLMCISKCSYCYKSSKIFGFRNELLFCINYLIQLVRGVINQYNLFVVYKVSGFFYKINLNNLELMKYTFIVQRTIYRHNLI